MKINSLGFSPKNKLTKQTKSNQSISSSKQNILLSTPSTSLMKTYFTRMNTKPSVSFTGTSTNYRHWPEGANGRVPLIIEPGINLTNTVTEPAYPRLECDGGNWSNSDITEVYLKDSKLPNSNFKEAKMSEVKLHGSDLRNSDFSDAYAMQAVFKDSNLEGSKFINTNLNNACFQNANLKDVDFSNADMQSVNLLGADLRGAKFNDNTNLSNAFYNHHTKFPSDFNPKRESMVKFEPDAYFYESSIQRAYFKPDDEVFPEPYTGIDFTNAKLRWTDMENINLTASDFTNARCKDASFIACDFRNVDFTNADLSNTNFQNSHFSNAHFENTKLINANLISADLSDSNLDELPYYLTRGALYDEGTAFPNGYDPNKHGMLELQIGSDLSGYNLTKLKLKGLDVKGYELSLDRVTFDRADLSECEMDGMSIKDASFKKTYLRNSNLAKCNLENSNFLGANLQGANLTEANLKNANLCWTKMQGAILDGANLEGATYIKGPNTIFPEGFDPQKHGMIAVELK